MTEKITRKGKGRIVKHTVSILTAAAMVVTSVSLPKNVQKVHAEEAAGTVTVTAPSADTFITNEEGKGFGATTADFNATYSLNGGKNEDGTLKAKEQDVCFGKNGSDAQTWYIAGKNEDGTLVLMCDPAKPMKKKQVFLASSKYNSGTELNNTKFEDKDVYANHYGASDLRTYLTGEGLSNFTSAEQKLMAETSIYTNDTKNKTNGKDSTYKLTDKLYAAYGDVGESNNKYITVGNNAASSLNNGLEIALTGSGKYASGNVQENFWLRTPNSYNNLNALFAWPGENVTNRSVSNELSFVPAMHLNLKSVLFASAAQSAANGASLTSYNKIKPMTFRMDGTGVVWGSAVACAGNIYVTKGYGSGEYLYVQGNDGTNDFVYSEKIYKDMVVSAEKIRRGMSASGLANCKIWIETTENNVTYAKEIVATANHNFTDKDGNDVETCKDCGVCKSVATSGNHNFTTLQYKNTDEHTKKCAECGFVSTDSEDVAEHVFTNGKCECGVSEIACETNNTYVEKDDLGLVFSLDSDSSIEGKVNFGSRTDTVDGKELISSQTWYIAGKNTDGTLVLMCDPEKPMKTNQMFLVEAKYNSETYINSKKYENKDVYANHYGASDLRAYLTGDALNNFTSAEQNLMAATSIYTNDTKNKINEKDSTYHLTDKLYAAYGEYDYEYVTVGNNEEDSLNKGFRIALTGSGKYAVKTDCFWLRTPYKIYPYIARIANPSSSVSNYNVTNPWLVVPAMHLNLKSVLFASVASSASSDAEMSDALIFRIDGTGKVSSTAVYDNSGIKVTKGGDNEFIYIQYKDGTSSKVWSKAITEDMNIYKDCVGVDSFANCKIWIEKKGIEKDADTNLIYAVMATSGTSGNTNHSYVADSENGNHKCTLCGVQANHDFTNRPYTQTTDGKHYRTCICGVTEAPEACSGGTATCTKKAVCKKCKKEYGTLASHTFVNGVCSVCKYDNGSGKKKPGFENAKITILIGDKVKSSFVNPNNKKVTYKTSNKKIVKVDTKGKLTAVKKGKATITATVGGKKYKLTVTVANPSISGKSSLKAGKTLPLSIKNANSKISWKTSNKKIATVSKDGVVKGLKKGKVTITATYNKKKYTKKITVK